MIEARHLWLVPGFLTLCLASQACGPSVEDAGLCVGASLPAIEFPPLDLQDPDISRHNLRVWVELLTSPRLRGRHAGEAGARDAAALVAAQMAQVGLLPSRPGNGYCQGFSFFDGEDLNVSGYLPGVSSNQQTTILVGAHYDGQGVHPAGAIYPGADDNASGVAAMLEVARLAARRELEEASRTAASRAAWIFVAFGAEEGGRQGARAFLRQSEIDWPRVELAVNMDMVGRPFPGESSDALGYMALGGASSSTLAHLRAAAHGSGLEIRPLEDLGELMPTISDAEVLATRLPTLLLSTALHDDHHELSDTPERIDYGQIEHAARLVLELADILTDR